MDGCRMEPSQKPNDMLQVWFGRPQSLSKTVHADANILLFRFSPQPCAITLFNLHYCNSAERSQTSKP